MAKKQKTNPSEFVAKIHPGAKPGEWQGHFENAPIDPKARAKAISKANDGLAKNAARHAKAAQARLHRADPTRY